MLVPIVYTQPIGSQCKWLIRRCCTNTKEMKVKTQSSITSMPLSLLLLGDIDLTLLSFLSLDDIYLVLCYAPHII